ncbi:MAG: DUF664 domain-containing protein [Acidimicrobiales bacterium]|jgi:hypothetical protein
MTSTELLSDGFGRIHEIVKEVLADLSTAELTARIDPEANSIAWLVWHLTRVQDDHISEVAGTEQVWTSSGFAQRFALPLESSDTGYGHRPNQVGSVTADAELLGGYFRAVHANTLRFVQHLSEADLDRVVDERWDPPVTLGVRLVSVIADDLQHAGQAAYIRGLLERRR